MRRWAYFVSALVFLAAGGSVLPEENPHVSLVPWEVVQRGDATGAQLTLFWIPASRDELRRSELLTSSELTLFASRCVAMRVVRIDDATRLASLAADESLPLAVLVDEDGRVLGRVKAVDGSLSVTAIEAMVRDELDTRAGAAESLLDDARDHAESGDVDAAIAMYESVWKQRCACPRQGRDAEKALMAS